MLAQMSASSSSLGMSRRQEGAAPSMGSAVGCTTSARGCPFLRGTGDTGGSGVFAACLGKIASAAAWHASVDQVHHQCWAHCLIWLSTAALQMKHDSSCSIFQQQYQSA